MSHCAVLERRFVVQHLVAVLLSIFDQALNARFLALQLAFLHNVLICRTAIGTVLGERICTCRRKCAIESTTLVVGFTRGNLCLLLAALQDVVLSGISVGEFIEHVLRSCVLPNQPPSVHFSGIFHILILDSGDGCVVAGIFIDAVASVQALVLRL
ncbi:unnamed protein product [Periconia digitata]|uniref:Uncharacterized protein n=1 Tax=Periconia digitata TaxID=1303443 RepID=A0A9W4XQA6_9PLEO|nr:unnamed protein product [Periconia digitata]